jgi:hypothetical protein
MPLWKESELNWYLDRLAKNDARDTASALFTVAELGREFQPQPAPTGNAKVIAYLERLINDNRLCVVNWIIPYTYGEMRWLAARVLACEYAYQGIEKPIILKDVIQPIRDFEIARIAQQHHKIANLSELVQHGLVPTKTEIIKPQDYAACCSKEAVEERKLNQDNNE